MDDIKIMLVDDMEQIIDYFKMVFGNESHIQVVETALSGKEAIEKAAKTDVDIVLMDIQMETDDAGIRAMKAIKILKSNVKFIINTIHNDDRHIIEAYSAGASDYITKSSPVSEIISTVRETYDNSTRTLVTKVLAKELSKVKTEKDSLIYMVNKLLRLTPTELKVLKLIYSGKTYREIAKIKYVEESTIRSFVNKILKKMEARNMKRLISSLNDMHVMELIDVPD